MHLWLTVAAECVHMAFWVQLYLVYVFFIWLFCNNLTANPKNSYGCNQTCSIHIILLTPQSEYYHRHGLVHSDAHFSSRPTYVLYHQFYCLCSSTRRARPVTSLVFVFSSLVSHMTQFPSCVSPHANCRSPHSLSPKHLVIKMAEIKVLT